MIIICYDGSEDAQAAADQAIRLFHDDARDGPHGVGARRRDAHELRAWPGLGLWRGLQPQQRHRAPRSPAARAGPANGARSARGVCARPAWAPIRVVEQRDGSIAKTVLAVAERVDAEAVVVGTRGRGAAKSALLGSVSHDLVHARRSRRCRRAIRRARARPRRLACPCGLTGSRAPNVTDGGAMPANPGSESQACVCSQPQGCSRPSIK